jgi:hypothetical protein
LGHILYYGQEDKMKLEKAECKEFENTPPMLVLTIDGEEVVINPHPNLDLLKRGYIFVGDKSKLGTTFTVVRPDGDEITINRFVYNPKLAKFILDTYFTPGLVQDEGPVEFESIFPGGEL